MSLDFCSLFTETDACQIWGTCPQQCQSVLSEQMKRPKCSCSVNYTSGYLMNTNIHTCYAKGNMLSWYTKVVALLKIMNMLTLCFKNNFPHHLAHKTEYHVLRGVITYRTQTRHSPGSWNRNHQSWRGERRRGKATQYQWGLFKNMLKKKFL